MLLLHPLRYSHQQGGDTNELATVVHDEKSLPSPRLPTRSHSVNQHEWMNERMTTPRSLHPSIHPSILAQATDCRWSVSHKSPKQASTITSRSSSRTVPLMSESMILLLKEHRNYLIRPIINIWSTSSPGCLAVWLSGRLASFLQRTQDRPILLLRLLSI